MTINQDINKIEDFLDEPIEGTTDPAPFSGTYRTVLGFTGTLKGNVNLPKTAEPPIIEPTPPPLPPPQGPEFYDDEALKMLAIQIQNQGIIVQNLNQVIENQLVSRIEYERNNPLINDSPVYDWAEESVPPGFQVTFTLSVPEGSRFFVECWNTSYNVDSLYSHTIDGISAGTLPDLTQPLADFGDIFSYMFRPPRIIHNHLILTAANLGTEEAVYGVFIKGFLRDSIKVDQSFVGQR